jgi:hypothetical protein
MKHFFGEEQVKQIFMTTVFAMAIFATQAEASSNKFVVEITSMSQRPVKNNPGAIAAFDKEGQYRLSFIAVGNEYSYSYVAASYFKVTKKLTKSEFDNIVTQLKTASKACPVEFTLVKQSLEIDNIKSTCK